MRARRLSVGTALTPAEIEELLVRLRGLLADAEDGDMTATPTMLLRLESAIATLEVVLGERPWETIAEGPL